MPEKYRPAGFVVLYGLATGVVIWAVIEGKWPLLALTAFWGAVFALYDRRKDKRAKRRGRSPMNRHA